MQEDERKPDLGAADDSAVEARVKSLMEDSAPPPAPKKSKKTVPTDAGPSEPTSAPELTGLPMSKEPLKIKVIKEEPEDTTPEPEIPTEPEEPEAPEVPEETPAEPEEPETEPITIADAETKAMEAEEEDDPTTAKAVDDIVAHESDELLKAEDEKLAEAFKPEEKRNFRQKVGHFFKAWWSNPKARWATIFALLLGIVAATLVPTSRYFVLNNVGVRGSVSVQVLDESTFQPLKNVEVSAHGVTALTDTDGNAKLEKIRLGPTELKIEKRAFAPITRNVTVGWGSNPQGEMQLTPVGAQYSFVLTDYLSGKGVAKVEAISGEASALSDENGKIKLTLEEPPEVFEVIIKGDDYREEKFVINANSKDEKPVQLVSSRKHVFISKRSGKYDVFKIDVDGQHEERILAGTGSEREDMTLIVHPKEEVAAIVSTREGKRNKDGYLLSTLTLINLKDTTTKSIATSERVQLVDWVGDRLVYVEVAAGSSAANPKRHRLMSYDYSEDDKDELASSNYFNDVMIAAGKLYYAPSSAYQSAGTAVLYRSDADGTAKQTVLGKEAWNLFRTSYDHIAISAPGEWYDYKLDEKQPNKLGGEPANLTSRVYVDSPDVKKSLWVDSRDGKGVLLVYETDTKEDKNLRTQSGLKNPVRWLNGKTVVYRIHTDQETADYAISLDGGEPRKIRDVTNTGGVDQWYYY